MSGDSAILSERRILSESTILSDGEALLAGDVIVSRAWMSGRRRKACASLNDLNCSKLSKAVPEATPVDCRFARMREGDDTVVVSIIGS